jgi:DNA-binding transcriptional MocR family regulator
MESIYWRCKNHGGAIHQTILRGDQFQNPSGITYSNRFEADRRMARRARSLFVEDNPYGEFALSGDHIPPVRCLCPDRAILLGSFPRSWFPRSGWMVCAPKEIVDKLIVAKQAADLHTSSLCNGTSRIFDPQRYRPAHPNHRAPSIRNNETRWWLRSRNTCPRIFKAPDPKAACFSG